MNRKELPKEILALKKAFLGRKNLPGGGYSFPVLIPSERKKLLEDAIIACYADAAEIGERYVARARRGTGNEANLWSALLRRVMEIVVGKRRVS